VTHVDAATDDLSPELRFVTRVTPVHETEIALDPVRHALDVEPFGSRQAIQDFPTQAEEPPGHPGNFRLLGLFDSAAVHDITSMIFML
jgi:hypothetical protein